MEIVLGWRVGPANGRMPFWLKVLPAFPTLLRPALQGRICSEFCLCISTVDCACDNLDANSVKTPAVAREGGWLNDK